MQCLIIAIQSCDHFSPLQTPSQLFVFNTLLSSRHMVSFEFSKHRLFSSSQPLHHLHLLTEMLLLQRLTFGILQISAKMSLHRGCSVFPYLKCLSAVQVFISSFELFYFFITFVTASNNRIYCFICLLSVSCNSIIRGVGFLTSYFTY